MNIRIVAMVMFLACAPQMAWALSCASIEGAEDIMPQNELIVRAKVVSVVRKPHIPLVQNEYAVDDLVTFQILDVYRGPDQIPETIKTSRSSFYRSWGPHMEEGVEGEYLFDRKGGDWVFAGPGGCTYYSEKVWQTLREEKGAVLAE